MAPKHRRRKRNSYFPYQTHRSEKELEPTKRGKLRCTVSRDVDGREHRAPTQTTVQHRKLPPRSQPGNAHAHTYHIHTHMHTHMAGVTCGQALKQEQGGDPNISSENHNLIASIIIEGEQTSAPALHKNPHSAPVSARWELPSNGTSFLRSLFGLQLLCASTSSQQCHLSF